MRIAALVCVLVCLCLPLVNAGLSEPDQGERVIIELGYPDGAASVGRMSGSQIQTLQQEFTQSIKPSPITAFVSFFSGGRELRLHKNFTLRPALTARATREGREMLRSNPYVRDVEPVKEVEALLDTSAPLVEADTAADITHQNESPTGAHQAVCVIDTGVDADHPALSGRVVAEKCFCSTNVINSSGCCPNGNDTDDNATDHTGHGTHVAGVIASQDSTYRGVAPQTNIVAVKVLNASGGGLETDVEHALEWCSNSTAHETYNISTITLSLGIKKDIYEGACDEAVLAQFSNAAANQGVFVVAASGNDASDKGITSPACGSNVTSVGAVYDDDVGTMQYSNCSDKNTGTEEMACFTNLDDSGSNYIAPDILAPGAAITAPVPPSEECADDSYCSDSMWASLNGTSMAVPHVAGAAVRIRHMYTLLYNSPPTNKEIEEAIRHGPDSLFSERIDESIPLLDVNSSVLSVETQGPSIEFRSPTPPNNSNISSTNVTINATVSDEYHSLSSCVLLWNHSGGAHNLSMHQEGETCFIQVDIQHSGNYSYRLFANDSLGNAKLTQERSFTIVNSLPTITMEPPTPENGSSQEEPGIRINASAEDNMHEVTSCSVGFNFSEDTQTLSLEKTGEHTASCSGEALTRAHGPVAYRVAANDSLNGRGKSEWRIINITNEKPRIRNRTLPSDPSISELENITLRVNASDPEDDPLTFSWFKNNQSATDEENITVSNFTLTTNYTSEGIHNIRVFISDGALENNISWTVNVTHTNAPPMRTGEVPDQRWYPETPNTSLTSHTAINLSEYFRDIDNDSTYHVHCDDGRINTQLHDPILSMNASNHTLSSRVQLNLSDANYTVTQNFSVETTYDIDGDGYNTSVIGGKDCADDDPDRWIGKECERPCYSGATFNGSCSCTGGEYVCGDDDDSSTSNTGSSSGGGAPPPPSTEGHVFEDVTEGTDYEREIEDSEVAATAYEFSMNSSVDEVRIRLEPPSQKKESVIREEVPHYYDSFEVHHSTEDSIFSAVSLQYRVNRSWLRQHDYSTTALLRYREEEGIWNRLQTRLQKRSADFFYYEAESEGFSLFAIEGRHEPAGSDGNETETNESVNEKNSTGATNETIRLPRTVPNSSEKVPLRKHSEQPRMVSFTWKNIAGWAVMIAVTASLVFYYVFRNPDPANLENYISQRFAMGHKEHHIRDDLKKNGWQDEHIQGATRKARYKHNLKKMEDYIEMRLMLHDNEQEIWDALLALGWSKRQVKASFRKVRERIRQYRQNS